MTPCGLYNDFCCGQDDAARACCNEGNATLAAQIPGGDPIAHIDPASGSPQSSACPIIYSASATSTPSEAAPSSASLKTQRNALIGTTAGFALLMLAAALFAVLGRRRLNRQEVQMHSEEQEKRRLELERDDLEQDKQRLASEKQMTERAIASLPASMRREYEAARRNLGSIH